MQLLDLLQAERIALINGGALVAAALVGASRRGYPGSVDNGAAAVGTRATATASRRPSNSRLARSRPL